MLRQKNTLKGTEKIFEQKLSFSHERTTNGRNGCIACLLLFLGLLLFCPHKWKMKNISMDSKKAIFQQISTTTCFSFFKLYSYMNFVIVQVDIKQTHKCNGQLFFSIVNGQMGGDRKLMTCWKHLLLIKVFLLFK